MQKTVVKFGGSSLADAGQFLKVRDVILSDPGRKYVVASAPGKRFSGDVKVTDMLYRCHEQAAAGEDYGEIFAQIRARFDGIIAELGLDVSLEEDFNEISSALSAGCGRDYMASRGEYLNSKLLSRLLGFDFLDPAGPVFFSREGKFDAERTNALLSEALAGREYVVIPGFFGADADGKVHTFSRGGSDITGSIVARAVGADLYENWTDVSGVMAADPRIVKDPPVIDFMSYNELRELSYMGASVLHEDAVFPVKKAGISINLKNTNDPKAPGTMIVSSLPKGMRPKMITGIAGRKGLSSIQVEKSMMNEETGFGAKLLDIFAGFGIPFEHCPTGIDTMSVIVSSHFLERCRSELLDAIREQLQPDILFCEDGLALIAVVGHGLAYSIDATAKIFKALADAGVGVQLIDQGSSRLNLILGVAEEDYEKAIRAVSSLC